MGRARIRALYESDALWARRARDALFAFDVAVLVFVIATSFVPTAAAVAWLDRAIGVLLACEFAARIGASRTPRRDLLHPWTILDAIAVGTFLVPGAGQPLGFLRALRLVRVMRAYHVLDRLRGASATFRANEEAFIAGANLAVFVFVMTGVVYATQYQGNPNIRNYADALYFTVTSLTTTGFGDITLPGTLGRMLSVVIMLAGVTLFLRLAQTMFRPGKVRFACPQCGLGRHEADAVCCKACGTVLNIPDEGDV